MQFLSSWHSSRRRIALFASALGFTERTVKSRNPSNPPVNLPAQNDQPTAPAPPKRAPLKVSKRRIGREVRIFVEVRNHAASIRATSRRKLILGQGCGSHRELPRDKTLITIVCPNEHTSAGAVNMIGKGIKTRRATGWF